MPSMVETEHHLQVGQVVTILRGRDAGKLAVIIRIEERFVWIADGDKRKYDSPKKKNVLHVRPLSYMSPEVITSIQETGRVSNGKLRFAVNTCKDKLELRTEKG